MRTNRTPKDDFTDEERMILASLRKKSGRTCVKCRWYETKGQHKGCYPEGKYRKFLSKTEFEAGCDLYTPPE